MMPQLFLTSDEAGIHTKTRFALPLRYDLEALPTNEGACFEEDGHTPEREQYFTPETARVLFHRAQWLILKPSDQQQPSPWTFTYWNCGPTEVSATVDAVRLVLFEPSLDNDFQHFRRGFLLVDICLRLGSKAALSELEVAIIPEILCNFNEVYRYWRPPFDEVLRARGFHDSKVLNPFGGEDPFEGRWTQWLSHAVKLHCSADGRPCRIKHEEGGRAKHGQTKTFALRASSVGEPDPRAFVWTAASTTEEDGGVRLFTCDPTDGRLLDCAALVKLLNVDAWRASFLGAFPDPPSEFEREWLKDRLYRRWANSGTVYGFSSHSGLLLCPRTIEPPIVRHFFTLYFDQTILLLYLRTMTFAFSERLSEMSAKAKDHSAAQWNDARADLAESFTDLRYEFALFTNMYQFPLLSSQQQGVEIYAIQRKALGIDELFSEVKEEIETTDEYLRGVAERDQSRSAMTLNNVAFVGLGLSLILAALGLDPSPLWAVWSPEAGYVIEVRERFGNLLLAGLSLGLLIVSLRIPRLRRLLHRLISEPNRPPPPKSPRSSKTTDGAR